MASGFLRFSVPEDIAAISATVSDFYLVYEDGPEDPLVGDDVVPVLEQMKGETIDLYIDDDEDQPGDPFHQMIEALEASRVSYFAHHDAYQERSRGVRCRAVIAYNTEGTKETRKLRFLDWQHGEPADQVIERQMANAGFDQNEIDEAMGAFFQDTTPNPQMR